MSHRSVQIQTDSLEEEDETVYFYSRIPPEEIYDPDEDNKMRSSSQDFSEQQSTDYEDAGNYEDDNIDDDNNDDNDEDDDEDYDDEEEDDNDNDNAHDNDNDEDKDEDEDDDDDDDEEDDEEDNYGDDEEEIDEEDADIDDDGDVENENINVQVRNNDDETEATDETEESVYDNDETEDEIKDSSSKNVEKKILEHGAIIKQESHKQLKQKLDCKSSNKSKSYYVKDWMLVGSTVLVRWTNGLYYVGIIDKVEENSELCLIRYEDDSVYWTHLKDIHKQLSTSTMCDSDILCSECRGGLSEEPNEIVICDVCNQGYHQKCHSPIIEDSVLEPDVPWTCRTCIYAIGTKAGGAEKDSKIGKAMMATKTVFPYDISSLTWNASHQMNHENIYCYCGGPGKYHSKMLQCYNCLQWFHEACIQVLEAPLLYGDLFYEFLCGICNNGVETVRRIRMHWSVMVAISLNNLMMLYQKQFFDLNAEIMPFILKNCYRFKVAKNLTEMSKEDLTSRVETSLIRFKRKFMYRAVKKNSILWGLKVKYPVERPLVFEKKNSRVQQSLNRIKNHYDSRSKSPLPCPLIYGACRKGASVIPKHPPKRPMKEKKRNFVNCNNAIASIPLKKKLIKPGKGSKEKKLKKLSKRKTGPELGGTCSHYDTLDSIIPRLDNFEGQNNPFFDLSDSNDSNPRSENIQSDEDEEDEVEEGYQVITNASSSKLTIKRIIGPSKIGIKKLAEGKFSKMQSSDVSNKDSCRNEPNKCVVRARRVTPEGNVEYLIELDDYDEANKIG